MRVLLANLRLLYQNRCLWFFYMFIGFLVPFTGLLQVGLHGEGVIMFVVLVGGVLPISAIVAWTQLDVMARLLAFRLPNHQVFARRVVFLVGVLVSLAVSLGLSRACVVSERPLLVPCSLFFASLVVFLTGVWLVLVTIGIGMVLALVGVFLVFLGPLWGLHAPVERFIIHSPVLVTTLGVMTAAGFWYSLGHQPWWCRSSAKPAVLRPAGGAFPETSEEDGAGGPLASRETWISRVLLKRMHSSEHVSTARSIWGALYRWSLPGGGGRRHVVATAAQSLLIAVLAWYAPCVGPVFFLIMWIGRIEERGLPLRSNVLFVGGRRERFLGTMVLLILFSGLWTLSIALAFSAVNRLGPYLLWAEAEIRYVGTEGVPMGVGLAVLLTAMFPLSGLLDVVFHRNPGGSAAAKMIVFLPITLWSMCTHCQMAAVPLTYAVAGVLVSLVICACGIYFTAMWGDLVSTKPYTADLSATEIRDTIRQLRGGGKK